MLEHCTIIGVAGGKREGKGTTAKRLCETLGFVKFSFADPLYDGLQAMFGINFRTDYWQDNKDRIVAGTGRSLRYLLQTLGTEWGRNMVKPDVWVFRLEERVRELVAQTAVQGWFPKIVIDDVRDPEWEADWIKRYGVLLKVTNTRMHGPKDEHWSEQGIPDSMIDFHLSNEYDIPHLYAQVDAVTDILGLARDV